MRSAAPLSSGQRPMVAARAMTMRMLFAVRPKASHPRHLVWRVSEGEQADQ